METIETHQTEAYPTRYEAFDHPGVWVEHRHPEHKGGYEFAVYHAPMPNTYYPSIVDGIYIEVVSYQGKDWLLSGQATRPDRGREQFNFIKRYPSYEAAKAEALRWLPQAEVFVQTTGEVT